MTRSAILGLLALTAGCVGMSRRSDEPLADIQSLDTRIAVDLRYATNENFIGQALYPVNRCLLRRSVAKQLAEAQTELAKSGLGLKVWDCYRPLSAQRKLWEIKPDPLYVTDPRKGSRHNRGGSVDLTLVDSRGAALEMPSAYDDFSEKAHRDYKFVPSEARRNLKILERAMTRHGFRGLRSEWWHFDAVGWNAYGLLDVPLDASGPWRRY
jgi:zinc D-Ala-D-Ala dipeptidase